MDDQVTIPLWIDLLAVFIAGLSGSLVAIRNRFDPAGVIAITVVSALGGGLIRDVLIGRGPPAALQNPDYLYTATAAVGVVFVFRQIVGRVDGWFMPIDAAALGLFTFVGMQKGLLFDLPLITAMLLGVITATGGGLLRDLLSGEPPSLLRPGRLSLTAALAGALVYAVLYLLGVPGYIDVWIVAAVVMALRLASVYLGWTTPEAEEVTGRVTAVGGTILAAPAKMAKAQPTRPAGTRRWLRRRSNDQPGKD